MTARTILVVGTADTKGTELAYLNGVIRAAGGNSLVVDVGTRSTASDVGVTAAEVASHHPDGAGAVLGKDDRGQAVNAMAEALTRYVLNRDDLGAIIGIGGGGGTSLITTAMRALPIGVPKLMVSTLASGDVQPFVGVSDITMMYSVADIAGLNRITRVVLANAGRAIAGMAQARDDAPAADERPAIGLTMFGVTTTGVTAMSERLGDTFDCVVFHATGTGGRALEKLVDSGMLTGVVDATTTEIADEVVGGVLSAGEDRLGAIARTGVPYVGSVGALDMVNFWGIETVPEQFRDRLLHVHNANVTLMRTTVEENRRIGAWIAGKLNQCDGPVRFLLPEGGVSAIDAPGQTFRDEAADQALFDAIEANLVVTPNRQLKRLPFHINDQEFADAMADAFRAIAQTPTEVSE